jgi:glutamate decarboxylase
LPELVAGLPSRSRERRESHDVAEKEGAMLARKSAPVDSENVLSATYGSRFLSEPVPKYRLPLSEMPAQAAYQLVHDELQLDGNPALNLATFVTTWMEPEADRLMTETLSKNYIDQDEYPQTTELQNRCVNMLARLYRAADHHESVGCATVGSSEAIHLAGLALKWRWRQRRQSEGKPAGAPNIVMGNNVQVCWDKFARYFEVEPRAVPLSEDRFVLGVDEAVDRVDENTIAVVGILGSTYTGEFEPIEQLDSALSELNDRTGWDVPIHVDAASGGFVAPFTDPDLRWDFRLANVRSINVSGHKYGLVYPGVGWVVWRERTDLPEDLIFHVNYLGGDQPTFNLNFSRGAGQIVAQYYNFLRLGRSGYTEIMRGLQDTASYLSATIGALGPFEIVSKSGALPLVCARLRAGERYSVFDVSGLLRERGWIVPAYTLAPDADHIAVLRVVVREGLSRDMADNLVSDLDRVVGELSGGGRRPVASREERPRGRPKTKGVC